MEVLHNSCNTDTHNLPDMYAHNPQALDIHIRQITCAHVTTIKCTIACMAYIIGTILTPLNTINNIVCTCLVDLYIVMHNSTILQLSWLM